VDIHQNRVETLSERTSIQGMTRKRGSYMLGRYIAQPDGSEQEILTTDDDYVSQTITDGRESSVESISSFPMESEELVKSDKNSKSRRLSLRSKGRKNRRRERKMEEFQSQESILEGGELAGEDGRINSGKSSSLQQHQVGFQVQVDQTRFPSSPDHMEKDPGHPQRNTHGDISGTTTLPNPHNVTPPTMPVTMSRGEAFGGLPMPTQGNSNPSNNMEQFRAPSCGTAIPPPPADSTSSSGYVPNTMPTLYRQSSATSCTSGYIGSSMCSSSGFSASLRNTEAYNIEEECFLPGVADEIKLEIGGYLTTDHLSGYQQPMSRGALVSDRDETSVSGKSCHLDTALISQNGNNSVENMQVEDEYGSLSSDSVFSESGISFQYAPLNHIARQHPSEGYHSTPPTPKDDSSDSTDYVNVDLPQIEDVCFHLPLQISQT